MNDSSDALFVDFLYRPVVPTVCETIVKNFGRVMRFNYSMVPTKAIILKIDYCTCTKRNGKYSRLVTDIFL